MKKLFLLLVMVASFTLGSCEKDTDILAELTPIELLVQKAIDSGTADVFESKASAEGYIVKDKATSLTSKVCGSSYGDGTGYVVYESIISGGFRLYYWDDNADVHVIFDITPSEAVEFCSSAQTIT